MVGLLLSCGDPTAQNPGTNPGAAAFKGKIIDIALDTTNYSESTARNTSHDAYPFIDAFANSFVAWRPGAAFAANEVGGAADSLFIGAAGLGTAATDADVAANRDAVEAPLKALADYKAKLTKIVNDIDNIILEMIALSADPG